VQKDGPRSNHDIAATQVQLIDAEGENRGIVSLEEALALAEESGLDLVEIVPNANPPVAKITDLGKLKYQSQKKAAETRKKQKIIEIKEIKMRRGREMAHQELGMRLLEKVKENASEIAKIEMEPRLEGRQMMMVLAPRV